MRLRCLIFDWDGTAVPDRSTAVPRLAAALARLVARGVACAVITGTRLEHVERQLLRFVPAGSRAGLFACANRGSEVYAFGLDGKPRAVARRLASAEENRWLDAAIEGLRRFLEERGLEARVVRDRMNRRKLDLIPEWEDPKKTEVRELLLRVRGKLARARPGIGLPEILGRAAGICREIGWAGARITSDIKHVEIGLTDKSDSIRWLCANVLRPLSLSGGEVLVAGDELGPIGGLSGSDALMRASELGRAVFVSVGVEPEGVPPWVTHLPGGPERFARLVEELGEREEPPGAFPAPQATDDPAWRIEQEGFDPSREREMESLFTLGNGRLGVRGALDIPLPTSQADLAFAGVYDRKAPAIPYSETEFIAKKGRDDPCAELVQFPSPFRLRLRVGGREVVLTPRATLEHRRILDLRNGLYFQTYRIDDGEGALTRLKCLRFACADRPHLLVHEIEIAPENHEKPVEVEFPEWAGDLSADYPHLVREGRVFRTRGCRRLGVRLDSTELPDRALGRVRAIRRYICVLTSQDSPVFEELGELETAARRWSDLEELFQGHSKAWSAFWDRADIRVSGGIEVQQGLRFSEYHLRIAANDSPLSSVGARGLTGRAYEGHVFWDAEIFMFPFYLHTEPEIARSMLLYRHRLLEGARRRAKGMGCRGACFPWESTVTGDDVTPKVIALRGTDREVPIFTGAEQIHVTADVAYAVMRYWDATLDKRFLLDYGVEILVETARFWASRVVGGPDGSLHLRHVIGPDEYHAHVDDNFFTNWMARFNLGKAAWAANWARSEDRERFDELCVRLDLSPEERAGWLRAARRLLIPRSDERGVIEQFAGFHSLREVPISLEERGRPPIRRLFEWKDLAGMKVIKQADVLMVPFLFPDALPEAALAANYTYYEPRCDHGSSLSRAVHAAVAARAGKVEQAAEYWGKSLMLDLVNGMRNTPLGIHLGSMGGTWQALVFHLLGARFSEGGVALDPRAASRFALPCDEVDLKLTYRGRVHSVRFRPERRAA